MINVMDRKEFLSVLKVVKPGVATKTPFAPLLSFFFTGEAVVGYNDTFAVWVPWCMNFKGGITARVLFDWLSVCSGDWVETKVKGKKISFSCGRSQFNTPLVPLEDLPWKKPSTKKGDLFCWPGADFISGLTKCSISMNEDIVWSHRMGVTFCAEGETAEFYSTTGYALARVVCRQEKPFDHDFSLILPSPLVKQLVAHGANDKVSLIEIDLKKKDWIGVWFESGAYIWGKLVNEEPKPEEFRETMKKLLGEEAGALISIPRGFASALRHLGVLLSNDDSAALDVEVKDGKGLLKVKSEVHGFGEETVSFPKHPDSEVRFAPARLFPALSHASKILLTSGSHVRVSNDDDFDFILALMAC